MIETCDGIEPSIAEDAYVHPAATVIGRVRVGPRASIWPGAVLRGDDGPITIGAETSIQDNAVAHITGGRSETVIGDRVTVGHGAILHGCRVDDDVIVGMGSILMDNAHISEWSIVGAGALVPPGKRFPPGVLILGSPARVARELSEEERRWIAHSWKVYLELGERYRRRDAGGG
ncbi:MAG: gamma carbonic anhydrase family protein [Deltaproteobacteria bacterium]|nr:MAG: gamma carbonic anhydrase family protein [Deltaproteobacteria bacterium]